MVLSLLPATRASAVPSIPEKTNTRITVNFPTPEITEVGEYYRVLMEGLASFGNPGEPKLPIKTVRVPIPSGSEVEGVRVSHGRKVTLDGSYCVEPAQRPVPLSSSGTIEHTPPDERIYNSSFPFPARVYSDPFIQSKRGYRILILNLYPVSYVPAGGELSYFGDMTVEVEFRPSLPVVDNPEAIDSYPQFGPLASGDEYKYVIITSEDLKNYSGDYDWQVLCNRKESRGITTKIVTLDWIYSNYSGVDNPEKIRNFIKEAYDNWGTEYVLLGGDDTVVPFRKFWVMGEEIPSDMYYSCLDGTFNYDNDDRWGEPNDGPGGGEVDLYAEVYVGRAPVAGGVDVSNFVRKTLAFEDFVPEDRYLAYMIGEYLGFGGPSEYAKDSKEEVRLGADNHGYTTVGFASCDWVETGTLYEKDGPWSKYDLIDIINSGVWALNHLGHGNKQYAMKLYNSDLDSLTNTEYFFAYSQTCSAGHFDGIECWAEKVVRMENGAAAVVMNARSGWGAWNSTDGPSQHFDREFWDAVFGENIYAMGWANADSKEDQDWYITSSSYGRWCAYELNLFGDPELQFHFENLLVTVTISPGEDSGLPGETLTYTVTVTNTGNIEDNYNLSASDNAGWVVMETTRIYPSVDTCVKSGYPNTSYGSADKFYVGARGGVLGILRSFLKFDVSAIPSDAAISSANLWVEPYGSYGWPIVQACRVENDDWGDAVTWNTQPTFGTVEASFQTYGGCDNYNVTAWVYSQLQGDKLVSICLKHHTEDTSDDKSISYVSSEYNGHDPYLEVTFSRGTISPTTLAIPPGESRTATLTVTIPENALSGTEDEITVTAISQADPSVSDNASCIARVLPMRIEPSDDADVYEEYPNNNYGSGTSIWVSPYDSLKNRGFLKFDLSGVPGGVGIIEAKLHLNCWKKQYNDFDAACCPVADDSWSEHGITWNNQPSHDGSLFTVGITGTGWYTWDVTSFVSQEFGGDKIVSFCIKGAVEPHGGRALFDSKEWYQNHPYLEVTYGPPFEGEWIDKADAPKAGGYGEAVVGTGNYIYIIRCLYASSTPEFWRYDPNADSWTNMSITGLPTGAFRNGTAPEWDGVDKIYALGGARYSDADRRAFFCYNISTDSWMQLADTPGPQGAGDAITWSGYDGYIYAILGSNAHGTVFARYNASNNTWETRASPPAGTDDGCSLVWAGGTYLYALRGEYLETTPLRDFWRYDLVDDSWSQLADIPEEGGVGNGGSLLWIGNWLPKHDDYIYALGGGDCRENPGHNYYRYSISSGSWEKLANIPYPVTFYNGNRLGFAACKIYYWQGGTGGLYGGGNKFCMYYPFINRVDMLLKESIPIFGGLAWDQGNYIYAAGTGQYDVVRYSILDDDWENVIDAGHLFHEVPARGCYGESRIWLVARDHYSEGAALFSYDPNENVLRHHPPYLDNLNYYGDGGIAYVNGYVYMGAASYDPMGELAILRYRPSSDSWGVVAPLPSVLSWAGDYVWGGGDYIYVIDDYDFFRYSISENSWEQMAAPPDEAEALCWDGGDTLYALGQPAEYLMAYSMSDNSWETIVLMPEPIHWSFDIVFANGALYVHNGYDFFWRIEVN